MSVRRRPLLILLGFLLVLGAAFVLDPVAHGLVGAQRPMWAKQLARAGSLLGTASALIPILLVLAARCWLLEDRRLLIATATAVVALVLATIASPALKLVFSRARPSEIQAGTFRLLAFASLDGSFPSGHSMAVFACAGVLALAAPRGRMAIYGVAAIVPVMRVVGGRHFVSDVVAGSAVGWVLSQVAVSLVARWRARRSSRETDASGEGED